MEDNQPKEKIISPSSSDKSTSEEKGKLNTSTSQPSSSKTSKWRDLQVRTIWAIVMITLFILILAMGHFYSALLVIFIVTCIYYELINLSKYQERNKSINKYLFISYYNFIIFIYFSYIHMVKEKISYLHQYAFFHLLLHYHNLICLTLYLIGFFIFINSLDSKHYRHQYNHFAYIHILLLIFGVLSSMIVSNIFSGIIWFLIPASCVIVNDIFAYIWGRLLGKHQLTLLSPKKTWEGFIGAFFSTLLWCYLITEFMIKYDFLMCPVNEICIKPFEMFNNKCDVSELKMVLYNYEVKFAFLGKFTITILNLHLHTFFIGMFASLYAPLGGLFASGFKRGIKIKDFADIIPGHGGVTDRMDCQFLMGIFTYVWLNQFIFIGDGKDLNSIATRIDTFGYEDKKIVFSYLKRLLNK